MYDEGHVPSCFFHVEEQQRALLEATNYSRLVMASLSDAETKSRKIEFLDEISGDGRRSRR